MKIKIWNKNWKEMKEEVKIKHWNEIEEMKHWNEVEMEMKIKSWNEN